MGGERGERMKPDDQPKEDRGREDAFLDPSRLEAFVDAFIKRKNMVLSRLAEFDKKKNE